MMKTEPLLTSVCRYCSYYKPQGRRGGMCKQLGVPVQGKWKACVLATPPFSSSVMNIEEIMLLENSLSVSCSDDCSIIEASNSEKVATR